MDFEDNIKESFTKVKTDIEGVKDELALALKRISNLESLMAEETLNKAIKEGRVKKKKY